MRKLRPARTAYRGLCFELVNEDTRIDCDLAMMTQRTKTDQRQLARSFFK
jgi:hypothetical protein